MTDYWNDGRPGSDQHADYQSHDLGAPQGVGGRKPGLGAGSDATQHSQVALLPGEEPLFSADFTSSPILRHIKTGLVVTKDRVIVRYPQYMFLVFKVGYAESSTPIRQICEVTTGRLLSRRRVVSALMFAFFGLFIMMSGVGAMSSGFLGALTVLIALVCFAVAGFQAWMARSLGLTVSHAGAGALHVDVDKLEFHDMKSAGTVIQRLIVGGVRPAAAPQAAPAAGTAAPVPDPPVAPRQAPPVQTPRPAVNQVPPPTIWRR
jgi:hypothetical protein